MMCVDYIHHCMLCSAEPSLSGLRLVSGVEGGRICRPNQHGKPPIGSQICPSAPSPLTDSSPTEESSGSLPCQTASHGSTSRFSVSYQHCGPKINNLSERYSWEGGSVTFMTVYDTQSLVFNTVCFSRKCN